jgi:hypothetical protein
MPSGNELKYHDKPLTDRIFRRIKTIEVTYDTLARLLNPPMTHWDYPVIVSDIPKDAMVVKVIDGSSAWTGDPLAWRPVFRVLMASLEWPEVPEGAYAPSFTPTYKSYASYAEAAAAEKEKDEERSSSR